MFPIIESKIYQCITYYLLRVNSKLYLFRLHLINQFPLFISRTIPYSLIFKDKVSIWIFTLTVVNELYFYVMVCGQTINL